MTSTGSSPTFILGSPRTGSSVLHWSLCQHPALWGSAESDFLHELAPAAGRAWERGTKQGEHAWLLKEQVTEREFMQRIGGAVDELFLSRSGGRRWVDQTPYYVRIAPDLMQLFPDAKFLVLVRDGRQAVPSIQSLLGLDFPRAVREWSECTGLGLECLAQHPDRCHPVCYEDLVLNTEICLRRVFEFLEEDHCEASVRFIRARDPINTSFQGESSLDKLKPRWHGWSWLRRRTFHQFSGGLVERLGYETDARWRRPFVKDCEPDIEAMVTRVTRRLERAPARQREAVEA